MNRKYQYGRCLTWISMLLLFARSALCLAPQVPKLDAGRRRFLERPVEATAWALALRSSSLVSPAEAMWQQWTPEDMLFYVGKAKSGNATSVLEQMDRAAETSWMMNMGPDKGRIIQEIIAEKRPTRVLEIGTFLGYMAISMATALPPSALLVTIEKDPVNHAAAVQILDKALGADALDLVPGKGQSSSSSSSTAVSNASPGLIPPSQSSARIESWEGASGEVLESSTFQKRHGRQPFDLVLMDHWKPEYAADLKRLEKLGLVRPGTIVLADNVVFPGAPELLAYLGVPFQVSTDDVSGQECLAVPAATSSPSAAYVSHGWKSRLISVPFEYRPLTPDAISYSERL